MNKNPTPSATLPVLSNAELAAAGGGYKYRARTPKRNRRGAGPGGSAN